MLPFAAGNVGRQSHGLVGQADVFDELPVEGGDVEIHQPRVHRHPHIA
jgi:hypothetical protein